MGANVAGRAGRARWLRLACVVALIGVGMVCSEAEAGKVATWRHESAEAFNKGKAEGVVISDTGRARLGRRLEPTEEIAAEQVWDLARTGGPSPFVYAATGTAGKVFRLAENGNPGAWELVYDAEDALALSLTVLPDGQVFAGTAPGGHVVDLSDPAHPFSKPDEPVQYIWDLAAGPDGSLYAATGPTGQLWKRSPIGDWSLLLDSAHEHLLCVAIAPDGSVYAGSDGEGLIYRVGVDGAVSVVYDAPQTEVHTIVIGPDGSVYAGTADEAGGRGSSRGATRSASESNIEFNENRDEAEIPTPTPVASRASTAIQRPQAGEGGGREIPAGGTATPKSSPGENAVYYVGPDGAAREIFRSRVLIYALALQGDRLLIGTGPEGQLFEVRGLGRESSPQARLDHGEILSLMATEGGEVWLGAGNPGGVVRLSNDYVASGSLTSDVLDTKLASRFGAIVWRAERPEGTRVEVQLRTGNVGEPDETWSEWSTPQTEPAHARAKVPPGRFAQYRVRLATEKAEVSPELRMLAVRYQTLNLPPEIRKLDVPDLSEADGATRQDRLNLKWDASDPNEDDLEYTLHIRKDGWPDWIKLTESPLTETNFAWDITAVPQGTYRLKLTADDHPSNPPDDALTTELQSESFVIDHKAPSVSLSTQGRIVKATLKDDLTRLVKAEYAVDGGAWSSVFPTDGLFDTSEEAIEIDLGSSLSSGPHVVMVRATDAAGNEGTGDAVFEIKAVAGSR